MSNVMEHASILIDVVPVIAEEEDLDTVTLAAEFAAEIKQALSAQPGYLVGAADNSGVRGDIIQVAGDVVQQAWNHKTEMASLFSALIATLTALSKHRRIGEIEISRGDVKVVLKDVDRTTVDRLVADFAAQSVTQAGPAKVTPRVSKKKGK